MDAVGRNRPRDDGARTDDSTAPDRDIGQDRDIGRNPAVFFYHDISTIMALVPDRDVQPVKPVIGGPYYDIWTKQAVVPNTDTPPNRGVQMHTNVKTNSIPDFDYAPISA